MLEREGERRMIVTLLSVEERVVFLRLVEDGF